jgi:uncharacterized protein (UPF0332 family)
MMDNTRAFTLQHWGVKGMKWDIQKKTKKIGKALEKTTDRAVDYMKSLKSGRALDKAKKKAAHTIKDIADQMGDEVAKGKAKATEFLSDVKDKTVKNLNEILVKRPEQARKTKAFFNQIKANEASKIADKAAAKAVADRPLYPAYTKPTNIAPFSKDRPSFHGVLKKKDRNSDKM